MSSFFNLGKKISGFSLRGGKGSSNANQKPLYLCSPFVKASLVSGDLKNIIVLPKHLQGYENEWIAANLLDFFNYINLYYGTISDFCTPKECAVMSAGSSEYLWTDQQKKSSRVSAPQYMDLLFMSIQTQLDDESLFPTKSDAEFPKDFVPNVVRPIFRQLFRVLAHIIMHHYDKVLHLEEEAHLNTLFAHFIGFAQEFDLLDIKKDCAPLVDLIDSVVGTTAKPDN